MQTSPRLSMFSKNKIPSLSSKSYAPGNYTDYSKYVEK
jgi:hypothetical protein